MLAVLGLIGLVSFKLDQRVKEMGVRKVLGVSVLQILGLFTSEMIKLLLISFLVTIPLDYFATDLWLNGFSYHIDNSAMPFVLVAFSGLMVTVLIVSLRSKRANSRNPVDSQRNG
jgi:putative ABC transport system permease protein